MEHAGGQITPQQSMSVFIDRGGQLKPTSVTRWLKTAFSPFFGEEMNGRMYRIATSNMAADLITPYYGKCVYTWPCTMQLGTP